MPTGSGIVRYTGRRTEWAASTMQSVLNSISQHSAVLLLALIVTTVGLAAVCAILANRVARMRSRLRSLLEGARGENLERMLMDHLSERLELQEGVEDLEKRMGKAEAKLLTTKRHIGLVRYNAFEDVGGQQSFALAVFDDNGDGALVTSLVGRAECRVYCKPLLGGRSERNLSQEEQRAIREALSSEPKSILSS
ncbi:MAG: DUF4446 family protein [Fimbriimonadaceae bacterium]|nr:DUF4446 family protein [Fimbriimonadaceae bacterium]